MSLRRHFNTSSRPQGLFLVSAREKEVLDLLSQGFMYKEIADKLGIGFETVRTYIRRIYEKLHVQNRTKALTCPIRVSVSGLCDYINSHLNSCSPKGAGKYKS